MTNQEPEPNPEPKIRLEKVAEGMWTVNQEDWTAWHKWQDEDYFRIPNIYPPNSDKKDPN